MRSFRFLALVSLLCGCTSNLGETGENAPVEVGLETPTVDPNGVLPGVITPGMILPVPTVQPPPGGWVLLPIVSEFLVAPTTGQLNCLASRPSTASSQTSDVYYRIRPTEPIRSLEVFRNGVSLRRIDWPTAAQLWSSFTIPREIYDHAAPTRTVTYSIVATDTGGRRGTSEIVRKISPTADLHLTGVLAMTGPASGAGVRIVRIPWLGVNLRTLRVSASTPVTGWAAGGSVSTPQLDPWGPASGISDVALDFTADAWTRWRSEGSRLRVYGETALTPNGCGGTSNTVEAPASVSSTPLPPPPPPPDPGSPPDGGSGGTGWLPTNCPWVCNWADHPDKVIVDYQRTDTECGATAYLARTRYRMCSLSGASAGAELSICSTQATPGGWSLVRNETRVDVCVPSAGSTSSNTRIIRKM